MSFQDVVNNATQMLGGQIAQPSAQQTQQPANNNPLGQLISAFNSVGVQPTNTNKIHSLTQTGGAFNGNPMNNIGLGLGAVATLGAPEDDAVMQAFTHNLGGAVGDITKTFLPHEIESAIQTLKGQPQTGQPYRDQAIKWANYIDAKRNGISVNSPQGDWR